MEPNKGSVEFGQGVCDLSDSTSRIVNKIIFLFCVHIQLKCQIKNVYLFLGVKRVLTQGLRLLLIHDN